MCVIFARERGVWARRGRITLYEYGVRSTFEVMAKQKACGRALCVRGARRCQESMFTPISAQYQYVFVAAVCSEQRACATFRLRFSNAMSQSSDGERRTRLSALWLFCRLGLPGSLFAPWAYARHLEFDAAVLLCGSDGCALGCCCELLQAAASCSCSRKLPMFRAVLLLGGMLPVQPSS